MPIIIQPACTFGIVVWEKPGKTHSENPKRKRAKREATAIARKVKTVTQFTKINELHSKRRPSQQAPNLMYKGEEALWSTNVLQKVKTRHFQFYGNYGILGEAS